MQVKFWGCRGSLPSSYKSETAENAIRFALTKAISVGLNQNTDLDGFIQSLPFGVKSTYGTNTPCVEIIGGSEIIICDAGSGIRDLGKSLASTRNQKPKVINLLMSHLHWDHIQGFPFFIPAYMQGTSIKIWGCHAELEDAFVKQQSIPFFPVSLKDMGGNISFHIIDTDDEIEIGGIKINVLKQPHPGMSYGYSFRAAGKKIVYSTDVEHTEDFENEQNPFIRFYKDADILIIDGQFNLADHLHTKQNWGHSSNLIAIEMAVQATAKKLCLFHSDHLLDDMQLDKFLADSVRYKEIYDPNSTMEILLAYDGMLLDTNP
jgi:phosphoribosyl 1,2-cyclic phosphodiesterase